jgi:methionyl-tRNA formyltransferase
MRIVFMGTPDFAVPSLRMLHAAGHDIVCVVTAPDKKRGRGQHLSPTPIKAAAVELGLNVLEVEALRDPAFARNLESFHAELFIIVAFRILPEEVFSLPSAGSFNLHASLLPRYRGAAPINWALMCGDTESGVTTFFLQKKVDTGNILLQERVAMTENMTAGELHDLLSDAGARVVLRTVELISDGHAMPQQQNDEQATPAPKIFRDTCAIPWEKSAREVHNHIRGLSPYPSAWSLLQGAEMKILESRIAEETSAGAAGSVIASEPELVVQCGRGSVIIR